jgi:hypothetical protein
MAQYKVLRGVANSFAHSFTSLMNYVGNDYVMGHLLRRARETGEAVLNVDLLAGSDSPSALLTSEVAGSVRRYVEWFPKLVIRHKTEMQYVRAARLSVTFELSTRRPVRHAPDLEESPYVCRVEIEDDRGKVWSSEVRDWWYPEPELSSKRRGHTRRTRWISRLGQVIRSVWASRARRALSGRGDR